MDNQELDVVFVPLCEYRARSLELVANETLAILEPRSRIMERLHMGCFKRNRDYDDDASNATEYRVLADDACWHPVAPVQA